MNRGIAILAIVSCLICSARAVAQTPAPELARPAPALAQKPSTVGPAVLVKDIATQPNNEFLFAPSWMRFVQLGSDLYFAGSDGVHGWELWRRRQGAFQKAEMVVDICPGECSAAPWQLTVAHGWLYFTALDGSHGRELWRSDGSAEGTELVRDTLPGLASSNPLFLTPFGTRLYFSADDGSGGEELWTSDGTETGTFQVMDIRPGSEGSAPTSLAVLGSTLYFTADDGQIGRELWRTDGTAAGTLPIVDLCPGAESCFWEEQWDQAGPRVLRPLGGQLILSVGLISSGFRLWTSDGTTAGTMPLGDVGLGWLRYIELGGVLYFQGENDLAGRELWRTDGTDAGTYLVRDIAPGIADSGAMPMAAVGADLYFRASDGQSGTELWKSDGTEAGTVAVKDIRPGADGSLEYTLFGSTAFDGRLVFKADDGAHGLELWVSDGTEAGTTLLRDIHRGPLGAFSDWWAPVIPFATEQELLFFAWEPESGLELWVSDGTGPGTRLAQDIDRQASSVPLSYWARYTELVDGGRRLFFGADDAIHGVEPWVSDGTAAGTRLLKDIHPGEGLRAQYSSSDPREFTRSCQRVFFVAYDGDRYPIWVSDGTEQGTYVAVDGGGSSLITRKPVGPSCEEEIFFVDDHLWRSDGTPSGTYQLSSSGRRAGQPTAVGRTVYFSYDVDSLGRELWKSDGTPAGTVLVRDIRPGNQSSLPALLAGIDSELLFVADDGVTGRELWKSDGTAEGTRLVADIRPGPEGSFFPYTTASFDAVEGELFFVADDGLHGEELWRSDGTPGGTVQVADILPGPGSSEPRDLVEVGGAVFFSADDGVHGRELWVADATLRGARLVRDINPGGVSALSSPARPVVLGTAGGRLFFAADDGRRGLELWTSDGTREGTFRLQDLHPGSRPSTPAHFTRSATSLFFTASDGRTGFELWRLPIPQLDD